MSHPYKTQPDVARWSRSVSKVDRSEIDPVASFPFRIKPDEKVATAGSCFAQHIARRMAQSGFTYLVTEPGHPLASEETHRRFQYGLYSARYGNIYSTRQLLQLFDEAFEHRPMHSEVWEFGHRYVDPLRPSVEPEGYHEPEEVLLDRRQHLARVRKMFEELDVFVFTLGLTEIWRNKRTGIVYPLCPGVHGGVYDPDQHQLLNLTVSDVVADLSEFIEKLKSVNPTALMVFTVSPVPLAATATGNHVMVSTIHSKSVLRVACSEIEAKFADCSAYFPSYEIITGPHAGGRYFEEDLRSVSKEGVDHVMRVFFRHATTSVDPDAKRKRAGRAAKSEPIEAAQRMRQVNDVICEEEMLDMGSR
ncbi:MAG: GSCFA domain-containing protein [Pseudomonadota bacterium]